MIKYRLRFGLHVDVAWYSEQPFAKTTYKISTVNVLSLACTILCKTNSQKAWIWFHAYLNSTHIELAMYLN